MPKIMKNKCNCEKISTTIWVSAGKNTVVNLLDQRKLPFQTKIFRAKSVADIYFAIKDMVVRGAPLIGVTAAYGMYFAMQESRGDNFEMNIQKNAGWLKSARPTAVNLENEVNTMLEFILLNKDNPDLDKITLEKAGSVRQKEIDNSDLIGENGLPLIGEIYEKKKDTVNILTHCNAGWLASVKWGTATAPMYKAHLKGIPIHIWVDETRPRNQGARLTAFELAQAGINHTIIPDNTGGHLMQHGLVDMVIVGSDRTTATGDVANKIGTYLKALAAHDNRVPFYVALPTSSIDLTLDDGLKQIPVEERGEPEVAETEGWTGKSIGKVRIIPEGSPVANFGFDITPSRLVTGLITELGICDATREGILGLFTHNTM